MSVSQIAVAAQFSFIALRNNDPASRVLVVFGYGFTSGVAGTASVAMRGAYGVLGVAAGSINPLYLSNAPPPGVSMAGSLAAAPGTFYGFPIIAAQPAAFYPSFPLMIVPPGWNFILCNQAVNAAINATVLYGLY
jgi:hypothetical protein